MNPQDSTTGGDANGPIRFQLYVAGTSARTRNAKDNLTRLTRGLGDRCEVEIIDVVDDPVRAEAERILATPTLIKDSPPPRRRITGDLSDLDKVRAAIGVEVAPPQGNSSTPEQAP